MIYIIRQWSQGNVGCLVGHLTERGVASLIVDAWHDSGLPPLAHVNGIIALGGPYSTRDFVSDAYPYDFLKREARYLGRARALGIPVLGVGQAHQLIGAMRGNHVGAGDRVHGLQTIELSAQGREHWLFAGIPHRFKAYENHCDELRSLSPGSVVLASSASTGLESVAWDEWTVSMQFHPEVFKRTGDGMTDDESAAAVQNLHGPNLGYDEALRRLVDNFTYRAGCIERPSWFARPWYQLQGTDSAA